MRLTLALLLAFVATVSTAQVIPGPRPGGGLSASQVTNIALNVANNINQQALSYYLRTNQSKSISGYYHMARLSDFTLSPTNNFLTVSSVTNNQYAFSFASQPTNGVGLVTLSPGSYRCIYWANRSNPGSMTLQAEIYIRTQAGVETEIGSSSTNVMTATLAQYFADVLIATNVTMNSTDRLVGKLKVISQTSNPNLTIAVEGSTSARFDVPVPSSAFALASSLTNNTVNAGSLLTAGTSIPAGNLGNGWAYLGSAECTLTGTTWTFNIPTARVVRIIGTLAYDTGASGLGGGGYMGVQINGDTANNYAANVSEQWDVASGANKGNHTNWFIPLEWSGLNIKTGVVRFVIEFGPGSGTATNLSGVRGQLEMSGDNCLPNPYAFGMRGGFHWFGGNVASNVTVMNSSAAKILTNSQTRVDFYGVK